LRFLLGDVSLYRYRNDTKTGQVWGQGKGDRYGAAALPRGMYCNWCGY
jgi:hypothetical protein